MEKEQFLKGLKNQSLCNIYAVKFNNIYTRYIEKEEKSRQNFIHKHGISKEEFWARYREDWDERWFYLGDDIVEFYNEMGWDFNKLSESKELLYSGKYEISYKNYVIQDIWNNLSKEQESEYGVLPVNRTIKNNNFFASSAELWLTIFLCYFYIVIMIFHWCHYI